jgi:Flp pilus assembly protein CpaB
MLLAGVLGVLLTLSVLRAADDTQPILVAERDLAPGTVVQDASVRVARVHADDAVLGTLFSAVDADALRGQVVLAAIRAGEPLTRSTVRAASTGAAPRVMSFPIARARAVGGALVRGDRVDVLAVDERKRAEYVLSDAEVVDVDAPASGALGGIGDNVTISLVVDADDAPALAVAVDAGSLMLVRATGAVPRPSKGDGGHG